MNYLTIDDTDIHCFSTYLKNGEVDVLTIYVSNKQLLIDEETFTGSKTKYIVLVGGGCWNNSYIKNFKKIIEFLRISGTHLNMIKFVSCDLSEFGPCLQIVTTRSIDVNYCVLDEKTLSSILYNPHVKQLSIKTPSNLNAFKSPGICKEIEQATISEFNIVLEYADEECTILYDYNYDMMNFFRHLLQNKNIKIFSSNLSSFHIRTLIPYMKHLQVLKCEELTPALFVEIAYETRLEHINYDRTHPILEFNRRQNRRDLVESLLQADFYYEEDDEKIE
jgi:hypothetical protein